ncbi:MAG: thiamine pyrophosphate-binding protein [Syntrophales bacterium]|jgi:benzoylformate decarboxylase
MSGGESINEILGQFLNKDISRRSFVRTLGAIGVSAAAITSIVDAAEAVERGVAPLKARSFTGTGGQLIVEQMKDAGVKYLFTNPGSFEAGFLDAFLDQPMQLILCMHEGVVVSAADGYAKVSREPGFVLVHVAATAQTLGQLYNAHTDGTPLVVTAGMRENESFSDDFTLAARPGWNLKDMTRQFTKISWETRDAKAIPTQVRRAFKTATTEPGGPVYLAFSEAAQAEKNVTALLYDRENFIIPNNISPSAEQLKEIAKALLDAKAPVIWLGDQVTKDDACAEVIELAELLSIPACDYAFPLIPGIFANFPHKHPLYAGGYNAQDKDLVLGLGFIQNFPMPGYFRFGMKDDTPMICISTSADTIGRVHPFSLSVVANTKLALRGLIDSITSMASSARIKQIAASRKGQEPDFGSKASKIKSENVGLSPIHPDELAFVMDQELDKNCVLVHEYQQSSLQFFGFGSRDNDKMLVSNKGICLGWGVGAAIGAKIASPDRQVVLNIGDGSLMYSSSGLWSMARYQVPVLMMVSNNHCYDSVRKSYTAYKGRMTTANKFTGTILDNPLIDFVSLAKSQGCDGVRVERASDLRKALRRGIEATRAGTPFLIDVEIARTGPGADSTWFQKFSVSQSRKKKV